MDILYLIFAVAATVWALVILRHVSLLLQTAGVILVGAVFGFEFFNRQVGPIPITIDRVLLLVVGGQWLIWMLLVRQRAPRLTRFDLLVVMLFGFLTASTFAYDWSYRDHLPLGRLLFLNWMPLGVYLIARTCRIQTVDMIALFALLGLFGLYLSVTAIIEVWGPRGLVFPAYIASTEHVEFLGRARGPFLNPVSCGIYQIVCAAAALMFWRHWPRYGKLILLAIAPIFLLGVFLTMTRSVWMAAAWSAFAICWLPATARQRGMLISGGVVAGLAVLIVFGDRFERFKRDEHVSEHEMAQSSKLRPLLAQVAWEMFKDRPVLGCGFGQYTKYKRPYHFERADGQPLRLVLPYMQHNLFLSYLTETGLVGLTLLVAVLLGIGLRSWQLWKDPRASPWAQQAGLLTLVALSSYLINGMFHDVSIIPMLGMLLWFLAGVVMNVSVERARVGSGEACLEPTLHRR